MNKNNLGDRMKQYENCFRFYLPKKSCVIIRCDGRSFHTFTKGFARPYDEVFASTMWETAKQLCENISGVRFCFTQSDEISLVLVDYENINTEPWFGNNLQKIVSISASMATYYFERIFLDMIVDKGGLNTHVDAFNYKPCFFDSRAFVLPREEVLNYMYWRQLDTRRNSIQLLGQSLFSHNQLQHKNSDEIREMALREKGIDWNEMPTWFRNGVSLYKEYKTIEGTNPNGEKAEVLRSKWCIDTETPIFIENKSYVEDHVIFNEGE